MKTRFLPAALFSALALLAAPATRAQNSPAPAPPPPAEAQRVLTLVVVDALGGGHGAITAFDRLDLAFHEVAKQRKWPIKIEAERFAANTTEHDPEVRIFYKGIQDELPGELTLRAWVTLTAQNQKHDFGMIRYRYDIRPGELAEDRTERLFRGAVAMIADKLEPVLFPKSKS